MVTEWVMSAFSSVVGWLFGLITLPDPPSFFSDAEGWWDSLAGYVEGTGVWLPWPLVAAVLAAWLVAMGAMVVIKGVRIAASFLTLGGGSAA